MNEHDDVLEGLPGEDHGDFSVGLNNNNKMVEEQQHRFQGIDASTNGKVKQEAGYAWTQTEEDLEVTIGLPAQNVSAKDIKVNFQSRHVSVGYRGQLTLELSLFEAIDVDGSTWTLDSNSETSNVVLVMDKVERAFWSRIRN
jgi:hypothetical protein